MDLPDPEKSRAVLIGVDRYRHFADLPAVRNNVRRLAELLTDRDLWGLPPEHCVVLHNPLSVSTVLDAVHEAASAAEDAFVVYFAGHGLISPTEKADLLLALPESDGQRHYRDLSYDAIRHELVDTCTASARVALLDCCYSGRALSGYMSPPKLGNLAADLAAVEGTFVMTASSETQLARAPEGEDFTSFSGELVKALAEGVPDAADPLEMGALYRHVCRELIAKGYPVPQQRARNAGQSIALTQNRWRVPDPAELQERPGEPNEASDEPLVEEPAPIPAEGHDTETEVPAEENTKDSAPRWLRPSGLRKSLVFGAPVATLAGIALLGFFLPGAGSPSSASSAVIRYRSGFAAWSSDSTCWTYPDGIEEAKVGCTLDKWSWGPTGSSSLKDTKFTLDTGKSKNQELKLTGTLRMEKSRVCNEGVHVKIYVSGHSVMDTTIGSGKAIPLDEPLDSGTHLLEFSVTPVNPSNPPCSASLIWENAKASFSK